MISVGGVVIIGGSGGLPSGGTAADVLTGDGAWTQGDDVVTDALGGLIGSVAGRAMVGDGAGGVQPTSAAVSTLLAAADAAALAAALGYEAALPRLPVAGARHHWRLDDAGPNFTDFGTGAATLTYIAGTREYGRAGVYARYGATTQPVASSATNRAEATVSIASGADISIGLTIANELGLSATSWSFARIVAMVHDGGSDGARNGILILTDSSGALFLNVGFGASSANSNSVPIDWSRAHRLDVTRNGSTGAVVIYVDGRSVLTQTIAGTVGALTKASLGGHGASISGTGASQLLCADYTVHTSVLSAATVLSRADVCRRLVAG